MRDGSDTPRDDTRWGALYAVVVVELALLVALFYALTRWAS